MTPEGPEDGLHEIETLVLAAARAAADKKASDIIALEVGPLLVVTDYFLLATGSNDRQVSAISNAVEGALRDLGVKPIGREGERDLTWVLLDFGDFVIHVFQPAERDFYRLERLWADAPRLDLPEDVVGPGTPVPTGDDAADESGLDLSEDPADLIGAEEDGGS
jgi:ribosome-associated protein